MADPDVLRGLATSVVAAKYRAWPRRTARLRLGASAVPAGGGVDSEVHPSLAWRAPRLAPNLDRRGLSQLDTVIGQPRAPPNDPFASIRGQLGEVRKDQKRVILDYSNVDSESRG